MSWIQMGLNFFAAISWPLLIGIVLLFKWGELRDVFGYLKSLKLPGGLEASFVRQVERQEIAIDKATSEADVARSSIRRQHVGISGDAYVVESDSAKAFSAIERRIFEIVKDSPSLAIFVLSTEVLQVIRDLGPSISLSPFSLTSLSSAGIAFQSHHYPLIPLWGSILIGFDDLRSNALNNSYLKISFGLAS